MSMSYDTVANWLDNSLDKVLTYKKEVLYGVAGVALLSCAGVGYHYYWKHAQAAAHKDFSRALLVCDAPVVPGSKKVVTEDMMQFGSDAEKWQHVAKLMEETYAKHKGSTIGGIIRAHQADALLQLGKVAQALPLLEEAVAAIPSEQLKEFYKVKLALVKLDSGDAKIAQAGLAELKKLAENANSFAHENALYYIGEYFWAQKDYAQARNYWQQYMVKYSVKETGMGASFAEAVRGKLRLISADW
jgi:tetratricopeptide (TPR) repeat protein